MNFILFTTFISDVCTTNIICAVFQFIKQQFNVIKLKDKFKFKVTINSV
jgi:hypothetical protein